MVSYRDNIPLFMWLDEKKELNSVFSYREAAPHSFGGAQGKAERL